jgi:hypothetical protein
MGGSADRQTNLVQMKSKNNGERMNIKQYLHCVIYGTKEMMQRKLLVEKN